MPEGDYNTRLYKNTCLQIAIKKGLTILNSCKPLCSLVGDTGFEPVTSTV